MPQNPSNPYRQIFERLPIGCAYQQIINDSQGNALDIELLDANVVFADMLGFDQSMIIGKRLSQIFSGRPDQVKEWVWMYQQVADQTEGVFERKDLFQGKTAQIRIELLDQGHFLTYLTPVQTEKRIENASDSSSNLQCEEKLRALIDFTPDIICFKDARGRWLEANKTLLSAVGLTQDIYPGKTHKELADLVKPIYRDLFLMFDEMDEKVWQRKTVVRDEEEMPLDDGSIKALDILKIPVFHDPEKKKRKVLVVFGRDITQLKATEKALQESKELYRKLAEDMPLFLASFLPDGKVLYANPMYAHLFGTTQEELQGTRFLDLLSMDEQHVIMSNLESITPERPFHMSTQLHLSEDGTKTWFKWINRGFFDAEGNILRYQAVGQNVTREKRAEETLKTQLDAQKMIAEISSSFVNAPPEEVDDKVHHALKACSTFFKVDRASIFQISEEGKMMSNTHEWCANGVEPIKEHLQQIALNPMKSLENDGNARMPVSKDSVESLILKATKKPHSKDSQSHRSLLVVAMVNNGKEIGFFSFDCMDQTRSWTEDDIGLVHLIAEIISNALVKRQNAIHLAKAREAAESASLAKSQFLANMSHELRTPLNGILGFAELLRTTPLTPDQNKYLAYIITSSEILKDVVGNILDFSKIEAGKMALFEEPTQIKSLCQQVIQLLSSQAIEKKIELRLEWDERLTEEYLVDSLRMQQVLLNLTGNAVKFTHEGRVILRVRRADHLQDTTMESIRFEVKDTGIGMTPQQCEVIFEEFEQADKSSSRRYGGTGLGLPIAKGLLEMMGSQLHVESSLGKGTVFSFQLKVKKVTGTKAIPDDVTASNGAEELFQKEKAYTILLVEDDTFNMILAKKMLQTFLPKACILQARDGMEAMELFSQNQPHLIFMDINMPVMNGYDATKAIREIEAEKNHRTPIIALTAAADQLSKEMCFRSGMDDYITKPFSMDTFKSAIQKWLSRFGENADV